MRTVTMAAVLAISGAVTAIAQGQPAPLSTGPCHTTKTLGSGPNFMKICITSHGNLIWLKSPVGFRHLTDHEGYSICSAGNLTSYDFAYHADELSWGPPTTTAPGVWPMAVTRSTANGKFKLVQKFTWDTAEKDVIIEMKLTNTSGATQFDVRLDRLFWGQIDNKVIPGRVFDRTDESVSSRFDHGLLLSTVTPATPHDTVVYHIVSLQTCGEPTAPHPFTTTSGYYGAGRVSHALGTMGPGVSKTVKVKYTRY